MKILLINPHSALINKSAAYKKFCTPIAPLGLGYIASVLEKDGAEVLIIDQFAAGIPDENLFALIAQIKPAIIGFSVLTPVINDVCRLVRKIRQLSRESLIVLGNMHAVCFSEQVLRQGTADIVVRGEGEMTMLELKRCLEGNKELLTVKGISYLSGGRVRHNPDRELIAGLDSLPYPAWHLLDLNGYREAPMVAIKNKRVLPVLASRGCPYRCYYCSQDKIYRRPRYREMEKVAAEMEYFHRNFSVDFFGFCDAYFPFDEKTGLEFCGRLRDYGLHKKIKWITETRVDKVSAKLLKSMKEAGTQLIMFGIEVGDDDMLRKLRKNTTLAQAREAITLTRKAGILSQGLFILGLPGETTQSIRRTINFAKELDCDIVKFNTAVPYPGSPFFAEVVKSRKLPAPEQFTSWFDWLEEKGDLIYTPEGMDSVTLRKMQRQAMFEFYLRPKVIVRHVLKGTIGCRNLLFGGVWLFSLWFKSRWPGFARMVFGGLFDRGGRR